MFLETSRLSTSSSEYSDSPTKRSDEDHHGGAIVVKSHSGWSLLRHWIHIAAIAVTAALGAINFLNLFLLDSDHPNTVVILNAFQFAAKLHEVLIVGSLMLIMMDTVRSSLITAEGVPFGFLLSPMLFSNFDWLSSHHFWSAMKPTRSSLPLATLILISIPFANVAGPLSAITVVPRLGWSVSRAAQIYPTFWNSSATDIWPTTFTASSLLEMCFTGAGHNPPCPGGALKTISVLYDPAFSSFLCTSTGNAVACNSSTIVSEPTRSNSRSVSVEYDRGSLTAYTSTPPPLVYELLASRVASGFAIPLNISDTEVIDARKTQLIDTRFLGNRQMLKPANRVTCQDLSYSQIYQTFQDFGVATNWSTPSVHWLADVDESPGPQFLFAYLRNDTALAAHSRCEGQECYAATTCSVTARWAPVKIWHNTAQSSLLFQSDPQPATLFQSNSIKDAIPVRLQKDWLETFTTPINADISTTLCSLLNSWGTPMAGASEDLAGQPSSVGSFQPGNYSQAISVFVSSIVTEAMATSSSFTGDSIYTGDCTNRKPGFEFSPTICNHDASFWIHTSDMADAKTNYSMMAFTVRRNGWGWFSDSLTVKIALGILIFHALLTLVYLVVTLLFRRKITTCWASAPEMLMLAVDSLRAPVLMGSSARAAHRDLWRETVSVVEVDGGERVSLVVGDPLSYPDRLGGPPVLGKKYN